MRTIRVTGKGQIKLKPDMIRIIITMEGTYPEYSDTFSDWYNYDRGFRQRITIGYIIAKAFGEIAERNLVIRRCGREKSPLRC